METGKLIAVIALFAIAVASLTGAIVILRSGIRKPVPDGVSTDMQTNAPSNGGTETTARSDEKKVVSLDSFLLRLSGMRLTCEYEIGIEGDMATVSLYYFNYSTGEERRVLEKSASVAAADMIAELNEVDLIKWDGFDGPHPRGVTDGTQFRLEATVNGGRGITAQGSQNFPKHYHDLVGYLDGLLRD